MRKITCIHPSRGRPEQAYQTAKKWIERAGVEIKYFICADNDDPTANELRELTNYLPLSTLSAQNRTAIQAINYGANYVFKYYDTDIAIVVSDDTDCPQNWAIDLLANLEGKSDFCAKVDDGLQSTLVTMPVMDRIYYERYGYIYHPEFEHLHCDEELTCVALMTGKYIKLPLLFPHDHPLTGRTQRDWLNDRNDSTWAQGQSTLDRHALKNFGIENPVIRREDIVWH